MDPNTRLKRILFRSAHRGTKESDLILGPYAIAHAEQMSDAQLTEFEAFLEESDSDIWDWISGATQPPAEKYVQLLSELRAVNSQEK